jgi:SAM-dependent MidA family methyltransferase
MDLSADLRREPPVDLEEVGEDEALAARIRSEISANGPLTFARFMELALYDPDGGYYRAAEPRPGRGGDFLTAPEAHPIFGHAMANQLIEVWERLDRPAPFVVREHGAGIGTLAEAILRRLEQARPELLAVLRYVPVEIDERRLDAFGERLAAAGFTDRIAPVGEDRPFTGVVLANEVLDALPVHRVGVRDGSLAERFVAVDVDGHLVDAWGTPSSPALGERLRSDGVQLAEGQSAEICLAIDGWIADAVQSLEQGLLLLVDYGAHARELYDAGRRPQGTVRAFVRHRVSSDLYDHIGRQDLTAHVDLTALVAAAKAAGLAPVGETSQGEFLIGNGTEVLLHEVQADPATTLAAYIELRSALMRLIDPAGMGGFRVMALGRAWPAGPPLAGFAYRGPGR